MFVEAIDIADKFTRAIHFVGRNYGSSVLQPGSATLFFINADGWAFTCRHVVEQQETFVALERKAQAFREELASGQGREKRKKLLRQLESKYGYSNKRVFELKSHFINCAESAGGTLRFDFYKHVKADAALLRFDNYERLLCDSFPVFPSDTSSLQPGKYLCRLGFPFPEFSNFTYDVADDTVKWTDTGQPLSPRFPIEGMVTRLVRDDDGLVRQFEMSTPGLRGQSGGPVFDAEGKVWGMQCATVHLDMDFDVDQEVLRQGKKKSVTDHAFLHVGRCVHVDVLKSFMKENGVGFSEV